MAKKEVIGLCTLYHCDNMELMATLPDKSIDLAIVDPPFWTTTNGLSHDTGGGGWYTKYKKKNENWKLPDKEYFDELFRVSDKVIIWGGNYYDLPPQRNFIIWDKVNMPENFSMAMCEYAWTNIPGNAKIYRQPPQDTNRIHPTQKPVKLYKWLLSKYAKQGDKILDTHFGSASIAVACNELGFELIASEIGEDYYNMACNRVREAAKQGDLFRESA